MARRKLSNTAAIVREPLEGGEEHSISTRKIGNGFVTCQRSYNPGTGECRVSETYTKEQPRLLPPRIDGRQNGQTPQGMNSLSEAKEYMRDV